MSDFKTRLTQEQSELSERVENLEAFLQTSKSDEIDPIQRTLLDIQLPAMKTYLTILNERSRLLSAVYETGAH